MHLNQRITAFSKLGNFLKNFDGKTDFTDENLMLSASYYTDFEEIITKSKLYNAWFTEDQVRFAIAGWAANLTEENLTKWLKDSDVGEKNTNPKDVAVIMAGNLPLVGFHDFLSVLISGHQIVAKLSSNDKYLLPFIARVLIALEPGFEDKITFTEGKLPKFNAVIATGSNNTARYFEYYFRNKPHIIRKNRNAVAVLDSEESSEQLAALGHDIFAFFGMGCRSVSKLYVPKNYDFDAFFNAIFDQKAIINHDKYANNYDYNKAVYLMGQEKLLDNNFLILKQDTAFSSPIAVVYYEFYESKADLKEVIQKNRQNIQCIVANGFITEEISFGKAQEPELWDYADGVNTIEFLSKID